MKWLTKALVSLYCIFPTFGQNCKIYEGNSKNIYNNILKVKKPYEIKDAFSDIKKCQIKSEEKLKGIATYFLEEKKTENPFSILSILQLRNKVNLNAILVLSLIVGNHSIVSIKSSQESTLSGLSISIKVFQEN